MESLALKAIVATALCVAFAACSVADDTTEKVEHEVMVVRIPPFYDPTLTPLQRHFAFHHFLYPRPGAPENLEVKGDTGSMRDLPHDDTLIYVVLSEAGEISINNERQASVNAVTERLSGVFSNREKMGVYVTGSDEIVKAVGVRVPESAKYPDLIRIVKAVKEAGADPVVLLLDEHLPYEIIQQNHN